MRSDDAEASRIDAIVAAPWELAEYERWLAHEPPLEEDYLFAEARARFEARDEDVVRAPSDLSVESSRAGVELGSLSLGGSVTIPGVSRASAERILKLIDGRTPLFELRLLAAGERPALERLLRGALGLTLFVPDAVAALEARLSGAELVRFVGTPYELVRAYWENMADVRESAGNTLEFATDSATFTRLLQRLHVIALMGRDLSRFYRPASKITRQGVRPGALYTSPSHTLESARGTLLVSGPRVGVALVGGEHYHALLYAEDPEALASSRSVLDEQGVPWGRVVSGRARDDAQDAAWFCPPRPLLPDHFAKLFDAYSAALAAAKRGDADAAGQALARFHYRFVRLHPFRCANQSLSMNLTNLVLERSHSAGIPHLLLDQIALRLSENAYVAVFSRALHAHALKGPAAERWTNLRRQKLASYALIERLKGARDLEQAKQLAAADPVGARAALLAL